MIIAEPKPNTTRFPRYGSHGPSQSLRIVIRLQLAARCQDHHEARAGFGRSLHLHSETMLFAAAASSKVTSQRAESHFRFAGSTRSG